MRKYCLVLFGFVFGLVFMSCNQKQTVNYDSMPEELAKIYQEIEKNPKDANLYVKLSNYYTHTKQLDSALNNALVAIRLDPDNSTVYVAAFDVYFSMENLDAAEEMLKKAIALDKKNNEAYLKLGLLYFTTNDFQSSKEILIQAIR